MNIARVVGDIVSTQKNAHFEGKKLLVVQPVELDTITARDSSYIAIDKVNAGPGELVLVNKEGSSARLLFKDEEIPVQAVIVAIIDGLDIPAS